jgi:carbonic anhydrase
MPFAVAAALHPHRLAGLVGVALRGVFGLCLAAGLWPMALAADKPAAAATAAASSSSSSSSSAAASAAPAAKGTAASASSAPMAASTAAPAGSAAAAGATARTAPRDMLSDKRLNPRTPAPAAASAAPPPVIQDPMDRLQERLAERLGARMAAAESKNAGELRLVARPAPGEAAGKGANPAGGRAAARPQQPAAAVAMPAAWAYDGPGGPGQWAHLKPEYAACGKGERQSPIDIRDGIRLQLEPLQFAYQPAEFRVIDNGHTVRVNVSGGNTLDVMGRRYELKYFQFHRPSEVRVDGKAFDMSAHLVHQDAEGRTAIVAVLLERGNAHPVVQAVWNNLPLEKGVELAARSPLDLNALLPTDKRYATFMGSMTTPPCQEGVLWMVMKTPVALSDYQLAVFARLYPMNARPVQAAHGRLIKESE